MTTVFVHGAGRGGVDAWPLQQHATADLGRCVWLDWPDGAASPAGRFAPNLVEFQVEALLEALTAPGNVVAHSHGAVAAFAAAERCSACVRHLVLFEPACFGLARGGPHVEEHIATMAPVLAQASDPTIDDATYAARFFAALGAPVPAMVSDAQRRAMRRLRRVPAPWELPVDPAVVAKTQPLVVTGGWHPLYEEVAAALVRLGAQHQLLTGHGHRPQDHPHANDLLRDQFANP